MDISTIRHISRNNSLHRPEDTSSIREVAEHCRKDLAGWQRKVKATKILLSVLESKVQATQKDIALCIVLSSPCPIRRLPSELLSLVFAFASIGDKLDLFFSKKYQTPVGFALVRVCKYWRDIALDTRPLWSHPVVLDKERRMRSILLMEDEEDKYQRQIEGILKLYGTKLARVHLHHDGSLTLNHIANKIFENQRHLVSFHFFGECDGIFRGKNDLRKFDMPLLEELFISTTLSRNTKVRGAIPFEVPNLNRLFLLDPDTSGFFVDCLLLPWQQITHLSFGTPYNRGSFPSPQRVNGCDFLRLLAQLPMLTYLHLTNLLLVRKEEGQDNSATPLVATTLHNLKSLEIHDKGLILLRGFEEIHDSDQAVPLLSYIETPALEAFDLLFSTTSIYQLQPLGAFLRCVPSLRRTRLALFTATEYLGLDAFPAPYIVHLSGNCAFFAHLDATRLGDNKDYGFVDLGEKMQPPRGGWLDDDLWMDHLIDRRLSLEQLSVSPPVVPIAHDPGTKTRQGHLRRRDSFSESDEEEDSEESEDDSEEESDEDAYDYYHGDAGENGDRNGLRSYTGREKLYYSQDDLVTIKGIFKLLADSELNADAERHVYLAI